MKIQFGGGVQICQLAVSNKAKPKGSWERQGICALPNGKMGEAKTGTYCAGVYYLLNILPLLGMYTEESIPPPCRVRMAGSRITRALVPQICLLFL